MRKCPVCQTVYSDDTLSFCLTDGAALQPPVRDPDETLPSYDPSAATLILPPAQPTNRTFSNEPRGAGRVVVPFNTAPQQSNTAPQVIKQGVNPIVVGVLAGLLVLAVGVIAAFMLIGRADTPTANANTQPPPTPGAVVTPQTQPTVQREVIVVQQPAPKQPAPNYPAPQPTRSQPPPPATDANQPPGDDLNGRNCFQLKVRRNEIFARHGYIFKTPDMIDYFSRQPWYRGTRDDVSGLLSPAERRTVARIQRYENSLGCR